MIQSHLDIQFMTTIGQKELPNKQEIYTAGAGTCYMCTGYHGC
jgi:hypothetical protein